MRIGLSYNLKDDFILEAHHPPDELEEYDCEETISALESAIAKAGHQVVRLGGGRAFLQNILREKVDLVFNIAEGWGGRSREAQIPAVLEMLGIPYTGSDPTSLALSQDKAKLKALLTEAGIPTPGYRLINCDSPINWGTTAPMNRGTTDLSFPLIVKPAYEGSSKGIRLNSVVHNPQELQTQVKWLLDTYHQAVLLEEYIQGEEITVGIVGNSPPKVVGIMQICPRDSHGQAFVYSLEVKRDWQRQVEYICPPRLSPQLVEQISDVALRAYKMLDCRDLSRVDIRLGHSPSYGTKVPTPYGAEAPTPYFIEINPLPGLNPSYSDLIIMTGKMGIKYDDLINSILNSALTRIFP